MTIEVQDSLVPEALQKTAGGQRSATTGEYLKALRAELQILSASIGNAKISNLRTSVADNVIEDVEVS